MQEHILTVDDAMKPAERRVRIFRNGANRALRIPRDLDFEGDVALIRKEGDALVVRPERRPGLLALLESWEPLDEAFPLIEDNPASLDDVDL